MLHGLRLNDANVSNIMLNIGYPLDLAGNIRVYIYDINICLYHIYMYRYINIYIYTYDFVYFQ